MKPDEPNGRVTARELYEAIGDLREEQREALDALRQEIQDGRRESALGIEGLFHSVRIEINGLGARVDEALRKYERIDQKLEDHKELLGHPDTDRELKQINEKILWSEKRIARQISAWALGAIFGVSGFVYWTAQWGVAR